MNSSNNVAMRSQSIQDGSVPSYTGISHQTILVYIYVCYTAVCQSVVIFGIVANIINIVCFIKQGIDDPMNISLLGLAISDLGCLIPQICTNIVLTPAISAMDLNFDTLGVFYLVSAAPHFTFTRITSWITAIITMERCLSVIAPLKVKSIITPKRVSIIIVGVFLVLLPCGAPVYVVNRLGIIFIPWRNRTMLGLISTEDRERVEAIHFAINNFILPFTAFVVIVISTAILSITLQNLAKWRQSSIANLRADVSNRSQRVAKMVVMISSLFIACFVPTTIIMLALAFEPGISAGGKHIYIGIIVGGIGVLLECVNSSVNIFIYYHMSSKYRDTFCSIFFCTSKYRKDQTVMFAKQNI